MRKVLLLLAVVLLTSTAAVSARNAGAPLTGRPMCPLCYVPGADPPWCWANYGKACDPPPLEPHCTAQEASLYCEDHPYNPPSTPVTTSPSPGTPSVTEPGGAEPGLP